MSIQTIEDLQAAFNANESKTESYPNNYYRFWDMKEGEHAVVRFLPDGNKENPKGFFVEKHMHNLIINGEKKNVVCPKTFDAANECPICKVSSAFYNKGDKVQGKAFWRKKQYLTQAIIIKDPLPVDTETGESNEGKVRCLALGWQLYNIIKDATMSGELDTVPYLFENGVDFIIKKSKQGDYSTYALGSKFMRQNRDLTEEEIALATSQMIDLATLLPREPSVEALQEDLQAALNGGTSDMDSMAPAASYDDSGTTETAAATTSAGYSEETDDGAGGDEADAILAEIRNRKKAG